MIRHNKIFMAFLAAGMLGLAGSSFASEIVIINKDGANTGLNDTSPTTPVGGNAGVTRGEQARNVFQFAANMWGAVLQSTVPIAVDAKFGPLQCDANGTVLGSTGTNGNIRFTNADTAPEGVKLNVWYSGALGNAYSGADATPSTSDMTMSFNGALGTASCLPDSGWYFGLDGNTPAGQSNLLNVMLHEMGHGLGFAGTSNLSSGALSSSSINIYEYFVYSDTNAKSWGDLTNAQRKTAALDDGKLVFRGPNVVSEAPLFLGPPEKLIVTAPASVAGTYDYGAVSPPATATAANFGGAIVAALTNPTDPATEGTPTAGCLPFTNAAEVAGKIALIDRGVCTFDVKVGNALAAGASGVILANNVAGALSPAVAVALPTITITNDVAATLRTGLDGLTAELGHGTGMSGTDAAGNVMIYAPPALASGSSFSHYDTRLSPNALMEYAESSDLQGHINLDLTPALFKDEGWVVNEGGQMLLTCNTGVPTWIPGGIVIGANIYSNLKAAAAAAEHFGIYRTTVLSYAAGLASQNLITSQQATTLNACLSDAELHNQFNAWGNGVDEPTDPTDPTDPGDGDDSAVELTSGVAMGGQSGAVDGELLYKLEVPAGATNLSVRTFGGTGDVSVFVKIDGEPSAADNNYKSVHAGNSESIAAPRPAAGVYYVKVVGVKAFSGVSVQGSFIAPH